MGTWTVMLRTSAAPCCTHRRCVCVCQDATATARPPWRHRTSFAPISSSALDRRQRQDASSRTQRVPRQASASLAEREVATSGQKEWPPLQAVLFDMDGVLCNGEALSRRAAAETLKVVYDLDVTPDEFIPFAGTGEPNFLGGVARKYKEDVDTDKLKEAFFSIYIGKYATDDANIGFAGTLDLVRACKDAGLLVAVASSAERVKVDANLRASGLPASEFDVIMSADKFERLKPAPDIFLAAAKALGAEPDACLVIEDATAGIKAAKAAGMRSFAVKTTSSEDELQAEGPESIFGSIEDISLDTIKEKYPIKKRQ